MMRRLCSTILRTQHHQTAAFNTNNQPSGKRANPEA